MDDKVAPITLGNKVVVAQVNSMFLSSIGRADGSWDPDSRATHHVMNDFLKLIISDK